MFIVWSGKLQCLWNVQIVYVKHEIAELLVEEMSAEKGVALIVVLVSDS